MTEDGASTIIDGFTYQRCPELRDYPACIHLQDEIGDPRREQSAIRQFCKGDHVVHPGI
jgi:hypothetical protein